MSSRSRPRGRRPGGEDTQATILAAARTLFARDGYDATSLRAIAREAGVDARLIHHWFTSKGDLFIRSLELVPINPADRVAQVIAATSPELLGQTMVQEFLTLWDAHPDAFTLVAQALTSTDTFVRPFGEFLTQEILQQLIAVIELDHAALRASLVAGQLISLGMTRYVVRFAAVTQATPAELAALAGPTINNLLFAPVADIDAHGRLSGPELPAR